MLKRIKFEKATESLYQMGQCLLQIDRGEGVPIEARDRG